MEKIKFDKKKYTKKKTRHKMRWQELAEEMTSWFGQSCFWLFWKFPEGLIRTEFGVCRQECIYQFNHLIYKLNNAKNNHNKACNQKDGSEGNLQGMHGKEVQVYLQCMEEQRKI